MTSKRSKNYPLYKRGKAWTYDFRLGERRYRKSTQCTNIKEARIVYKSVWKHALEEWEQSLKQTTKLNARTQINSHWGEEIALAVNDKKSWLWQMHKSIKSRGKKWPGGCLTLDELAAIAYRSDGKCEVTGIPFSDEKISGASRPPYAKSIDRINSARGYTRENCRLVCHCVNVAMMDWGDGVVQKIAQAYNLKILNEALHNNDTTL